MYLAEVEHEAAEAVSNARINGAVEKWRSFPASRISDHGGACCRLAREWLVGMDRSLINSDDLLTGPRWIRQRYSWGPSSWPIYWCEAVERKVLDCGVLAGLTREVYLGRGVECYETQFIEEFTRAAAENWHAQWEGEDATVPHWIKEDLVYHEGCALLVKGNELKVWDPTPAWWVTPRQFRGYGAVLALRVTVPASDKKQLFRWGTHEIPANHWVKLPEPVMGPSRRDL